MTHNHAEPEDLGSIPPLTMSFLSLGLRWSVKSLKSFHLQVPADSDRNRLTFAVLLRVVEIT